MNIKPSVVFGCALGVALPVAFVACSLGEGVTPECNPNAPPSQADACFQVSTCDNGMGGVIPREDCCVEAGNQEYSVCDQKDLDRDADFRDLCIPGGSTMPSGCCNPAQAIYTTCMQGNLSTSATGGGGGAGGAGGMPGGAGGTGGSGGSGGSGGT